MQSEKQPQPLRLFLEVYLISGHVFSLIVIESFLSLKRGINVKKPRIQGREWGLSLHQTWMLKKFTSDSVRIL